MEVFEAMGIDAVSELDKERERERERVD